MKAFRTHRGLAVVMAQDNVNTDQIIPSREMKRVSKVGLSDGLFANIRYTDAATGGRTPDPEFVLNQPEAKGTSILISGANFGCGSSREHAVWALKEFGFRVIVAESFGTIFYDNCIANGVLPITLAAADIQKLAAASAAHEMTVDLEAQCLRVADIELAFSIPETKRQMLLNGWAPIDVTLQDHAVIDAFVTVDKSRRPWLYKSRSQERSEET